MEPMNIGSPPSSPASPNINPNFLPAFLIGGDAQQSPSISPGRNKSSVPRGGNFPTSDPRNLRQKLFNQSMSDSFQVHHNTEKGGPPKQGLFDTFDGKAKTSNTPIVNSTMNNVEVPMFGNDQFSHIMNDSSMNNSQCLSRGQPDINASQNRTETYGNRFDRIDTLWVTIFGFPPSAASLVLAQLSNCGTIVDKKYPTQGNWLHIKFGSLHDVSKALALNGKLISNCIMIGIVPFHNKDNKENVDSSSYTSPVRARSLRLSYASPQINNSVLASPSVPQKSTGIVTKAMEYVFGW